MYIRYFIESFFTRLEIVICGFLLKLDDRPRSNLISVEYLVPMEIFYPWLNMVYDRKSQD